MSAWHLMAALLMGGTVDGQVQLSAGNDQKGLPETLSGMQDSGRFSLYINEERIGQIATDWEAGGSIHSRSVLNLAGQTVSTTLEIQTDESGIWTRIAQGTPMGEMIIERTGSVVSVSFMGRTTAIDLKPGTVLFDNNCPALISQILMKYRSKPDGKQTYPLLLLSGSLHESSIEKMDTATRSFHGTDILFHRYKYALPGVDALVWADEQQKVYLVEIPVQKAYFVRDGYELLKEDDPEDNLLSRPDHDVSVMRNTMILARDHVGLATDIYRPDADGRFPVILIRTPYRKEMLELTGKFYARRGYIFAIQDCRGRFASEGIWEPFVHEPEDGYDTIEWLADQPYSNGKVGMIGASYLGWVQWWAAMERPPHLVTIVPNVSPPDPVYNIPYEYGVFFNLGSIWWADVLESEATADLTGKAMYTIGEKKYSELLKPLPVIEQDRSVLGKENPYWRKWILHQPHDSYWDPVNFLKHLKRVKIPVFHQSGWFDGDGIGSKLNYLKMKSFDHPDQKLVLGPWGHTDTASRSHGDMDFGPDALIDLNRDYLRWFDYWLKGTQNGILKEPLVRIFVMGSNQWLTDQIYPLSYTEFQKWYFTSNGQANTSGGDGGLTVTMPIRDLPPDRFTYDPGDPSPNPDYFELTADEEKSVMDYQSIKERSEKQHEAVIGTRKDILVYQSGSMESDLTIAGPIEVVLFAASSARDTDWFVRLVWTNPENKNITLCEGKIRARYRRSIQKIKWLKPGKIEEYRIDLWQTGITIPKGSRLSVEVASASFPVFSRNLNTGGNNETETRYEIAQQTVYHDPEHPSHIILPVIPSEKLNQ